jgi:heme/copper-type cytochrome/quinol oxidase subunit 2
MILLGLEITGITVGIFLVVAAVFFYVIYSYLSYKSKDFEDEKTTIYIYSIVPSIIIGVLFVFLYEKYLKKMITNKQELLQEDFYS